MFLFGFDTDIKGSMLYCFKENAGIGIMLSSFKILKNAISVPVTCILYACAAGLIIYRLNGMEDLLYGLRRAHSLSEINLMQLAGWLVILFMPHIANAIILERCELIKTFTCIRTGSLQRFKLKTYAACFINSLLWSAVLWGVHLIISTGFMAELFMVLSTHILMWSAVTMLFYSVTNRSSVTFAFAPLICVLSIGFSCTDNLYSDYLISSFGMLNRGSLFNEKGILPVVQALLNIVLSAVCIVAAYIKDSSNGGTGKWKLSK